MHRFVLALIAAIIAAGSAATTMEPAQDRLPPNYEARHKGGVSMGSGLYTREDEDIVVPGIPPLILRRTYLSGYRASKQFGIGATHNGEIYLHGDFQTISLIHARGWRIPFERASPGPGPLLTSTYESRSGPDEWLGAQLRFVIVGWNLKRRDGSEMMFLGCGPIAKNVCSIIRSRGPYGETIEYRRDSSRRLAKMEAGSRWIAFEYDAQDRISRAYASTGRSVEYEYDDAGRLIRVRTNDDRIHRYSYTERDELATIEDPGTTIENYYDSNGRVIRQVNRYPDDPDALTFTFSYRLQGTAVVQSESRRSDSGWRRYTFDERRDVVVEEWGSGDRQFGTLRYERDAQTGVVSALTITCPERNGQTTQRTRVLTDGDVDTAMLQLAQACFSQNP